MAKYLVNFIVDGFSSYPSSSIYNSEGSKMSASDIKRFKKLKEQELSSPGVTEICVTVLGFTELADDEPKKDPLDEMILALFFVYDIKEQENVMVYAPATDIAGFETKEKDGETISIVKIKNKGEIREYISPINKIFFGNKKEMQKQIYEDICKKYNNIYLFSWEYEHYNYMKKKKK